jgi:hypothetical protein
MIKLLNYFLPCAVVKGGLHGRPRGTVAGIVYGAARSRQGKVVTAREYVIPGDTDDEDVLEQRLTFKSLLHSMRYLAAQCWQDDYNRSVGQLPGFHSLFSVLLQNCPHDTMFLAPPPDTPLGNLYTPGFTVITHPSVGGSIRITWTTGHGTNGTDADPVVVFLVEKESTIDGSRGAVWSGEVSTRTDGTIDVATGSSATDWVVACYFRGAGLALGKLSAAKYYAVTSA